jgi:hypothetical protein
LCHFRLVGVRGLRVVDASLMPDLISGNINAPVIMLVLHPDLAPRRTVSHGNRDAWLAVRRPRGRVGASAGGGMR